MKYKIDVVRIRENSIQLNGWVIGKTPESVPEFQVTDGKGKPRRRGYQALFCDGAVPSFYLGGIVFSDSQLCAWNRMFVGLEKGENPIWTGDCGSFLSDASVW